MHLYLAGYRGTGKSTVATVLGQRLNRPVIDLDDRIESDAAESIRQIFDRGGETLFRELESRALKQVCQSDPAVISLGGGAILSEDNRDLINSSGLCVWLDADAATIAQRLGQDATTPNRRPALTTMNHADEIEHLLAERRPLYQQVADFRVDTAEQSVQDVTDAIVQWLRRRQH